MSLIDFLQPLLEDDFSNHLYAPGQMGEITTKYIKQFPDVDGIDLAIIGVIEERGAVNNSGVAKGAHVIRKKFYQLYPANYTVKIADLGNIAPGATLRDTYFAIKTIVEELIAKKITPIIIGGSQDLTLGQFLGYQQQKKSIEMIQVDAYFDLEIFFQPEHINSRNYLSEIVSMEPTYLFNFSNIGYQTYFVNQEIIRIMDKLYFDIFRLGEVRGNIKEMEPVLRSADMVSIDLSVVRSSDAIGNGNSSPNGLNAEDICQLCRYAGYSDKLSSIGFYEYNPDYDIMDQSGFLVAEMIWSFIDGFYNRKVEDPTKKKRDFYKYRAYIHEYDSEIVFYKSKKTERWWMEIPAKVLIDKNLKNLIVPCSLEDYIKAMDGIIPDRWFRTLNKYE